MKLFIKYMVSNRCKLAVTEVLKKLKLQACAIDLGEVVLHEDPSLEQKVQLKTELAHLGFELIENKKEILVESIKNTIIEFVHHRREKTKFKFSVHLSRKLEYDYNYMAKVFSSVQGITIEQFIIAHKIERIKEMILYDEYSLTEIAWKMDYSSVAHLSNQFKKNTGLSPTLYKQQGRGKRSPLEDVGNRRGVTSNSRATYA